MRLGQHETTGKRLHRLGFVSTYQVGEPAQRLLAKAIEADGLPADEMLNHASDDLLASARLQHAAEDAPGIVKVIALGEYPAGRSTQAYAIYERYDDNARLFLGPRARPDAATVADIIEQARAALHGFSSSTGRPHGHATLNNILIKKQANSATPAIALTDPLPAIADPARSAQADRRALGNLLLALVTGRSADTLRSVEVPSDRDWTTVFGSVGGSAARQLCHDLLFDTGTELPSSEAIQQSLRERQGPVNTKSIAAIAAILLLALAAGLGWMLTRPPTAPTAQLADAAEALARYPAHFRRFVNAQDPDAPNYQRLSEFLVLLSNNPWDPEATRRPPTGPGTVYEIDAQIRNANETLTNSQLGRTSTAVEGLWRAIATTPDDAPPERWDAVARAMLTIGQDETSRNAELMFGAITTMAENFAAAASAADAYTDAQRARIEGIRAALNDRGIGGSLESIALMDQRLEALGSTLFEFFAPRVVSAAASTGVANSGADPDFPTDAPIDTPQPTMEQPEPQAVPAPAAGSTRIAMAPGLPAMARGDIAELFDAALALEDLLRTVEGELARTNDIGEPVQIVQALRGDGFTQLAPPAFREQAREPLKAIATALARSFDAALASDLATLLDERTRNGGWDTTIDRSRGFTETARVRNAARVMGDRLRGPGVVAELGWLAVDEPQWSAARRALPTLDADAPPDQWPLADWSALLATPRFTADPQRYAIDAWTQQLESWERALREADETNDPRYAQLRLSAGESLRSPEASPSLAHWPTPERHSVVTARYDELLQRVEVAVRVLDPCFPLRAEYIETTIAELEARLAGPIDAITPETAHLIRAIAATVRDRDEVRADRSTTPSHPRQQCANAARFAARIGELIAILDNERSGSRQPVHPAWADRAERVYLAALRRAWFTDGQSPTTEGWTEALARRMFAEQAASTNDWTHPDTVSTTVSVLHDRQISLAEDLQRWAWVETDGFRSIQQSIDEIARIQAVAEGGTPPVPIDAADDETWIADRITARRLLAAEEWLCTAQPPEQIFRRAIIAGAIPENVLPNDLQGNWLRDDSEFAFLWVRRRTGCPPEALPIPESADEFMETAGLVEVMRRALDAAPADVVGFPELEELPERLYNEGLAAVVGYATNHMTPQDWSELTDPHGETARARREAFERLGLPLHADAQFNPWLHPIEGVPTVSARARANWALWDAITSLSDPANAEEPRARAIVDQLVSRWNTFGSESASADAQLSSGVRDMSALPARLAARPPDFTLPGALPPAWTARPLGNDWNAIEITIPNHGTHRFLGARSTTSRGYPSAYIAQNELSIGFTNALFAAVPETKRLEVSARFAAAAELNRSTLAPVGWSFAGDRLIPNDPVIRANEVAQALDGRLSSHGWFSLQARREGNFTNLAARLPELPYTSLPNEHTPVQLLPAEVVIDLLSRVPSDRAPRLATLDEWQQLAGSYSAAGHSLNLRDMAFQNALQAEQEFFQQEPAGARFITTLRTGRAQRGSVERILPAAIAQELRRPHDRNNDGHALFAPVNERGWLNAGDEGTRLRHAYGNVAEIVATPGGEHPYAIVGGSALSSSGDFGEQLSETIPLQPRDLARPFTDVGFRIAINAPGGQPYAQVALEQLRGFGFLPPASP